MNTIWHTDTLLAFNKELYEGLLRAEHLTSQEISKKYNFQEVHGYTLEKDTPGSVVKERYFLKTDWVEKLPVVVTDWEKFSSKSEVYRMVKKCETRKIPAEQRMSLQEMVEFFANYAHSNPLHWKLARAITLALYFERNNLRIVSEAAFGKDALIDILKIVNGGVANLYNATLARMKYALHNDFIVINELGGLKNEEISALQIYLTQAGAWKQHYENNSRGTAGTKEIMDISTKSHLIFHNIPSYYVRKKQQFFEEMFTKAVHDRFPGILLSGYVQQDFSYTTPIEEFTKEDKQQIKDFISSLNYYKQHPIEKAKYELPNDFWGFEGREKQRSLRSFKVLAKYFSHMAKDESEFVLWCELLKKARLDYKELTKKDKQGYSVSSQKVM